MRNSWWLMSNPPYYHKELLFTHETLLLTHLFLIEPKTLENHEFSIFLFHHSHFPHERSWVLMSHSSSSWGTHEGLWATPHSREELIRHSLIYYLYHSKRFSLSKFTEILWTEYMMKCIYICIYTIVSFLLWYESMELIFIAIIIQFKVNDIEWEKNIWKQACWQKYSLYYTSNNQ